MTEGKGSTSDLEKGGVSITRTTRELFRAMHALLEKRYFRRITTKDICEEASLSRAAFYSRFTDKYDLLRQWLASFKPGLAEMVKCGSYQEMETATNEVVGQNKRIIENIITDSDAETFDIILDFFLSSLNLSMDEICDKETDEKHAVLAAFYSGGIINYLQWFMNQRIPLGAMNSHLYEIINQFQEWRFGQTE